MNRLKHCIFFALLSTTVFAECVPPNHDALALLLNSTENCPRNVFALRDAIKKSGYSIKTTMVANRGFHNPALGSFSLFELIQGKNVAEGDWFIGHFTAFNQLGELIPDQSPENGSLMIETFAWDPVKGFYNFYELRGDGRTGQWFYRGDSTDIFADNRYLHRQPDARNPQFGDRLRCSGCHMSGGPIMKELTAPHNDWWEPKRKLDFGGHPLSESLRDIMQTLVVPEVLATATKRGLQKLQNSAEFQAMMSKLSLQEQLRPLFCPMELNLQSDVNPNELQRDIKIPMQLYVDVHLLPDYDIPIYVSRMNYQQMLVASHSHFPETKELDGDHAWLAPLKAESDNMAVEQLLKNQLITTQFVSAVVAIDFVNPQFSTIRCELLKYIPENYSHDWKSIFIKNLQAANTEAARTLALYLTDPKYQPSYFKELTRRYLINLRFQSPQVFYQHLLQTRHAIRVSEISKNPRGQILEPGFRVIFPETLKVLY